jgi:hypothetical protein
MTPAAHNLGGDTREKLPICERLRDYMVREKPLRDEAADTIEALVEALEPLVAFAETFVGGGTEPSATVTNHDCRRARTALSRARNGGQP